MGDLYLIPEEVPCPQCNSKFPTKHALYLLSFYTWILCTNCQNRIYKEDIGKYLGVIKDVRTIQ